MSLGANKQALMGAAGGAAAAADFYDYQIANSVRFLPNGSSLDSTNYLSRTQGTPTNVDICTISLWVKRSKLGARQYGFTGSGASGPYSQFMFGGDGSDPDKFYYLQDPGTPDTRLESTALYRDPSAWYHIVIAQDSTQGTPANRNKVYFNGVQYTDWGDFTTYTTLNADFGINTSGHKIFVGSAGAGAANAYNPFDGYIAEYVFIDGTQNAVTDFGESKNGVWIPKDPSGLTFGNNGCYLKFESSGDLGNDSSGNNNDFTVTGVATHDQMLGSPTFSSTDGNGGNFCTANAVYRGTNTTDAQYGVLSEGNLTHTYVGSANASRPCTHKTPASGKWYFEYRIDAGGGSGSYGPGMGIMDPNVYTFVDGNLNNPGNISYDNSINKVYKNSSIVGTYSGTRGSDGDVMGIAVDMDNGAFYVSKQGTYQTISSGSQGDPTSGASRTGAGATWTPASEYTSGMVPVSQPVGGSVPIITMNFGQNGTFNGNETAGGNADANGIGNFFTAPPTDYLAVCSGNLTTAAEVDPAQTDANYPQKLFNPTLYTGSGGTQTITGVGFQPDFTWIKNRGATADHVLMDSTRGAYATDDYYYIRSNTTAAQDHTTDFHSFESDGFEMGGTGSYFNASGNTFVSWNWRANGGTTSTNTAGDINSTVQVDPSGCFSIVTYTGTTSSAGVETVGHGLDSAPNLIIFKGVGLVSNWWVFSDGQTSWNYGMNLNSTAASTDKSGNGSMSTPTATVFSTNNTDGLNDTEGDIAYCFANCEGYIKSGTYVGNGNADGTFVYTGFRPAMMILKEMIVDNWGIYDDKRLGYNLSSAGNAVLYPDLSNAAENDTSRAIDILSNGFKLRTSNATFNAGSGNYIYFAMSHNPFQYSLAR